MAISLLPPVSPVVWFPLFLPLPFFRTPTPHPTLPTPCSQQLWPPCPPLSSREISYGKRSYLSFWNPGKRKKRETKVTMDVDQQPFFSENFTQNILTINEAIVVLWSLTYFRPQFYAKFFSISHVIIEIVKTFQIAGPFFCNGSNSIQAKLKVIISCWRISFRGVASPETWRPKPSNFWLDHSIACNELCQEPMIMRCWGELNSLWTLSVGEVSAY